MLKPVRMWNSQNFYHPTGNLTQEGDSMDQRGALNMFKKARL